MRLIDADELKKILSEEITRKFVRWDKTITVAEWETFIRDIIDNAPTVTPNMAQVLAYESGKASVERPQGEWNYIQAGMAVCPFCGGTRRDNRIDHISFCNKCGAKMKGGKSE